jgi:serine/alanine adding enzyme
MSHGRKHAMAKARRAGVEAVEAEEVMLADVGAFSLLYAKTMARRRATGRWEYSTEYFARLLGELHDNAALIFSRTGGAIHTGAIILFGGKTAYYHYAASGEAVPTGAGDLVILEAARIAAERGCQWLHLGGGLTADPDDSLLAYKASFGGERVPVFMRRRIFDLGAYDRLTSEAGTMGAEFFPAYRAKEAA